MGSFTYDVILLGGEGVPEKSEKSDVCEEGGGTFSDAIQEGGPSICDNV